jgi:hypothetical protein
MTRTRTLIALLALAPLAGCDPSRAPPRGAASDVGLLATVNGVAITDRDLEHRARRPGGGMGHGAERSTELLQAVVQDELVAQKAIELGLDRDPEYRRRLDDLEAQVRAFRRQELASRLRTWAREHAEVPDAEARDWFEKNATLVRTRYHVLQIFHRGHLAELLADHAEVRGGTPFEEVAGRRFVGAPVEGRAPWDLGELSWSQLPPSWRGIVDRLQPGQVSDVIRGEGERAWVVKLAGKRVDPAVSFETERERIATQLRVSRAEAVHAKALAEAKAAATVTYTPEGARPATRTASAP